MSPRPITVPFGKHLPDRPTLDNPGTTRVRNVIPADGFLRPFRGISPATNALDERAQGAISGRDTAGNVYSFAGDRTKLYKRTAGAWSDVSKTATTYLTPIEGGWEFIPWSDDILIAINGVDAPQKIDPQTGTDFVDLGGSPPPARHGAVVGSFVFLGNWTDNENAVAWSALDNAEEWNTNGLNQSDQAFLPSGGAVMRIMGGEVATVFAQSSIHRFTYAGSPVAFSRDEIAPGVGLLAAGGAAQFGNLIFFIGQNSFYAMGTQGEPRPLGESRWHKTFFADLDQNHIDRIVSAIDPVNTIWIVAYPGQGSIGGSPNRMFLYNWTADDCSFVDIEPEYIFGAYTAGIDLDSLTTETGDHLDALQFSLDSRVWQGGSLVLAAFDNSHRQGFFSGETLEAIIDTGERDLDGGRVYLSGARPLVDAPGAEIAFRLRETPHDNVEATAYTATGPDGVCPHHASGRYASASLRIPRGALWTKAQGVEVWVDQDGLI